MLLAKYYFLIKLYYNIYFGYCRRYEKIYLKYFGYEGYKITFDTTFYLDIIWLNQNIVKLSYLPGI